MTSERTTIEGEGERQRAGGRGPQGEGERQRAGGRGPQGTHDVREGDLLWTPSPAWIANTNLTAFLRWLEQERDLQFLGRGSAEAPARVSRDAKFADYHALWRWSVDDLDGFWQAMWDYFDIQASVPPTAVLGAREMPGAEWFPGARLNYAQHVMRRAHPGADALLFLDEATPLTALGWDELTVQVRVVATQLRAMGVQRGDRVVAYLPNVPQAVIAMLAVTSIGAIWASCSPDFGWRGVLDRFGQLEPVVLLTVDGYRFGGTAYDRTDDVRRLVDALPSLRHVIHVPTLDPAAAPVVDGALRWHDLLDHPAVPADAFEFAQVAFDHPLWILFSSGTTGLPKPIVHGHGGILLEQLKLQTFHMDLREGDRLFFFTTTSWMMWNFVVSSLLLGVCPLLYDGSPTYPDPGVLWQMAQDARATFFGASPSYIDLMSRTGVVPGERYDLSALRAVMPAGAPVSPAHTAWFYRSVKQDLWVATGSGGTDCCTGFVGGAPTLPVRAGEIQAPHLGVAARAFNERGEAVINEVGELVMTEPMPSMPVRFWGDAGHVRYRETYFADFPGVWRQGDFFRINERGGCFVLGRSDATLNRHGVRIGTAEIYRVLATFDEISDALVVNLNLPGGGYFMPLFVALPPGQTLDAALEQRIRDRLRTEYSPRHVPDRIIQVPAIPATRTGKKMEVPVRKILLGTPEADAVNRNVMADPGALDAFVRYAASQQDYAIG